MKTILFTCFWAVSIIAQPATLDWSFSDFSGDVYDFALAGGLNNPQFSTIDLDGDGVEDLLVFDRTGNVILPFLSSGSSYEYAPQYVEFFPTIYRTMMLRDYNCDGVMDIFAYREEGFGSTGIEVYRGARDGDNNLTFSLVVDFLSYTEIGGTTPQRVYSNSLDIPAIDDIDGDGDMDILAYSESEGYIEWYSNQSQELGYGCDSLILVYVDDCWGRFLEDGSGESVLLSPEIDSCVGRSNWSPLRTTGVHGGSTLLSLDMNDDGVKELIMGDLTYTNLNLLSNTGDSIYAFIAFQEIDFPRNSTPTNMEGFPGAYHCDVDHDGIKDLLVTPHSDGFSSVNQEVVWWYKNVQSNEFPIFSYRQKDFFVDEMIDVGSNSAPDFVDFNGDGLLDIVVGNYAIYRGGGVWDTRLTAYENVGTLADPAFQLFSNDFAGLQQHNFRRLRPTFGDLDGDNDIDIIVGRQDGSLVFVENTGTIFNPDYSIPIYNYSGIDVGQNSTPQLVDLDRDGDLDLVVGERNGNINYFDNSGSAASPSFSAFASTEALGLVETKLPGSADGNSVPYFVDINGSYYLWAGMESGEIWLYGDIDGNLAGTFTQMSSSWDDVQEGQSSTIALADLDGDDVLEVLTGSRRGGLHAWAYDPLTIDVRKLHPAHDAFSFYPNPAQNQLTIQWNMHEPLHSIEIVNALGQSISKYAANPTILQSIELGDWSSGMYFIQANTSKRTYIQPFIKQ